MTGSGELNSLKNMCSSLALESFISLTAHILEACDFFFFLHFSCPDYMKSGIPFEFTFKVFMCTLRSALSSTLNSLVVVVFFCFF